MDTNRAGGTGSAEDREGRPFAEPAGKLLDRALEEVGTDRRAVYVTNVVKHFKYAPRGKRRIHRKPAADEVAACRPWLDAELALVRPTVVVCPGATAAQALLGRSFRITQQRGRFVQPAWPPGSWPPCAPPGSCGLRTTPPATRKMRAFVEDLKVVAAKLAGA